MISEEHLQISDILAFRQRRLSVTEHSAATRHLLRCAECRNRLPLPTADEFWRCLMGSNQEIAESRTFGSAWISIKDRLSEIVFGRPAMKNAAVFAVLLLFVILGLALLLITSGGFRQDENLVAAIGNTGSPELIDKDSADNSTLSPDENSLNSTTGDHKPVNTIHVLDRKESGKPNGRSAAETRSGQQAETRGTTPCGGQRFVGLEARLTDAGLLLKWEKVRGAVTYDIYLSDLDEKLIEHFETPDQTSHLVSAELIAGTVYKLRLIVTLESGQRVVSESRNFKVDDLTKGSQSPENIGIRRKTAASVRCVEVKQ